MYSAFIRLLRLASIFACVLVIASFALFALNETGNASTHQREALSGTPTVAATSVNGAAPAGTVVARKGPVRKAVEDASGQLTSPFTGITSGIHSEWAARSADLLLALCLYGFGLGYVARALRVRA